MPHVLGLGVPELLIILAVVLLLFGGSRLAGLGKSTGRALKEFKEETKGLKGEEKDASPSTRRRTQPDLYDQQPGGYQQPGEYQQPGNYQPPAGGDSAGTDPRANS